MGLWERELGDWWRCSREALRMFTAFLLPLRCCGCDEVVRDNASALCGGCRAKIITMNGPACPRCAVPLDPNDITHLCGACLKRRPAFAELRALFVYAGILPALFMRGKYRGHSEVWRELSTDILNAAHIAYLKQADLIVPVPMHRRALLVRGYNQAQILSLVLGARANVPCIPWFLEKAPGSAKQTGLTRKARVRNARGLFLWQYSKISQLLGCLPLYGSLRTYMLQIRIISRAQKSIKSGKKPLQGMCVAIVDDVVTTGSTMHEIARILRRKGGAARVIGFSLARTPRPEPQRIVKNEQNAKRSQRDAVCP